MCLLRQHKSRALPPYGDTVVPNGMPAIVTQELFDQVQKRLGVNKRKPAAKKADVEIAIAKKKSRIHR